MKRQQWSNTIECILDAPLPVNTDTYTCIPHSVFLKEIRDELENRGYTISEERYLTARNCNIISGVYKVASDIDSEMCPAITFVNSYNKTKKASIRASAMILVCKNGMCGTVDNGSYIRKHTGNALEDFREHIKLVIDGLDREFARLVTNKEEMKKITLTKKQKGSLLGDMLIEGMITSTQMSILMKEIKKSSHKEFSDDSLWSFYNHVTEAYKDTHPMIFDTQHVKFHTYICDKFQLTGSRGLFEKIDGEEKFLDFSKIPHAEDIEEFEINPNHE